MDPRQSEYLALISEATDHVKTVVQDLLKYAQQPDRQKAVTDLRTVVSDAVKLAQPRLNRNNIRMHVQIPEKPCTLAGVKSHLVQVVVNGIINAVDAIDRDGNIWIALRRKTGGYIITIEDDGTGLCPEASVKAFEPFFTTKGNKGTGLGLYVSFGIVKGHLGSVELRDRAGEKGAVLSISLPSGGDHEHPDR